MGQHYQIEYQPSLPAQGAWQVLTNVLSLAVSPLLVLYPATNNQQFFRAVSLP